MAVYPCDWERHRYVQAQKSVYFTELLEHVVKTYKLRLCPQHFDLVVALITEHLSEVQDESLYNDQCEICSEDMVGTLSAKVYPGKSDPVTYVADLCAADFQRIEFELRVRNGQLMNSL